MKKLCIVLMCLMPWMAFAQQYTGLTGLIHVPTAEMATVGQVRAGTHFINREMMPDRMNVDGVKFHAPNAYLAINPFSWLELAYTMTFYKGAKLGLEGVPDPNDIGYHFKDRYLSVKVQLLKETEWLPSVAIGTNDPFSTSGNNARYFGNYFVAASKHIIIPNHLFGVHVAYRKWRQHTNYRWNGLVGGITYRSARVPDLRVIAEYTGDAFNVGADWRLWKHVLVQASLQNCKYLSCGLCVYMNIL